MDNKREFPFGERKRIRLCSLCVNIVEILSLPALTDPRGNECSKHFIANKVVPRDSSLYAVGCFLFLFTQKK